MRSPNLLYLLLSVLSAAGALRVTTRTSSLSVLRDKDVTIPCDISDLNTGRGISVLWRKRSEDGSEQDVCESIDGRERSYRPNSSMKEEEILRGNAELHIPRVQFSDEGVYTCTVINTPDKAQGTATLEVSAPPLADVSPAHPNIELGTERTVMCDVHNFYPKEVSIRWAQYRKGSSDCEFLEIWTCVKRLLNNSDGTYNVTSVLTLNPKKEDDGNTYSCVISHRSLQSELSRNFTLTVTEREDNTGAVVTAVALTLLAAGILGILCFLYIKYFKKDPPSLSEITGNRDLIDMNRTTLTLQIMDFRPNNIEVCVCMRRSGSAKETIYRWRSGRDDLAPDEERMRMMNGAAGSQHTPLQMEMNHQITKKKLGTFSCQCSLHITPSYELDNGAQLSVHVIHPARTSPASAHRTLHVIGVPPKLLSIMTPTRIIHDEQLTLTCPINGFKPRRLSIAWLRRDKDHRETQLITWSPEEHTADRKKYSHNVKEDEHDDKSYSFISALTMKANIREDDGVTYICRTFHPATSHQEEKHLTMAVTALPVLDPILRTLDVVCVGEKLDLSCRIHSFYPPHIQVAWYMDGDVMPSHTTEPLQEHGGLYHVTSKTSYTPTMGDLGREFRCAVQHDSLSKPKLVTWRLADMASPPTVGDIQSDPAHPELGKLVTLSCAICNIYPGEPDIQWYQKFTKLDPKCWKTNFHQDPESGMFSGTTELTLTPTSDHHEASFRLEINNRTGNIIKTYLLHLKGVPVLSEISSDPRIAEYGQPLTLRCDVTGCNPDDITGVTWSERGQQRETRGSAGGLSSYLTITPSARDYGKVYVCSVTHRGIKQPSKNIHLCLSEKPPTLSDLIVRPATLTANQKASFQVTISGFSPRDLQIKWYKEFSMFHHSDVTGSEPEIALDGLYTCSSTLAFTPSMSDDKLTIRCEVTHSQSKTVREKRHKLDLTGYRGPRGPPGESRSDKKMLHIREIRCVTERPRVDEEVTLVAYIEGCQADGAEFSWYNGMFSVDGEIENQQDGHDCTSTVTFTLEKSNTDCTIKLEVFYNYQTAEESYTLPLA